METQNMMELNREEIGALEKLMNKASSTLQQAVDNGYRPEYSKDLELYDVIRMKLLGTTDKSRSADSITATS